MISIMRFTHNRNNPLSLEISKNQTHIAFTVTDSKGDVSKNQTIEFRINDIKQIIDVLNFYLKQDSQPFEEAEVILQT